MLNNRKKSGLHTFYYNYNYYICNKISDTMNIQEVNNQTDNGYRVYDFFLSEWLSTIY